MKKEIKCPYCKSLENVKRGLSPTQNRGKQQRHLCKECKRTFIQDLGFWKMKNNPKIITMSVDMYLSNLSSRKMRNQLKRHLQEKVSHVTVLDWVRKYVLKVGKFINKLQPTLSGKLYADETEVKRKKNDDVFWCSVDWDSRYVNASLYSDKPQNQEDAVEFFKLIKNSVEEPIYIQTDAREQYPIAFKKIFRKGRRVELQKTEHRVNNVSKTKKHNVRIETVFSKLKDRIEDFRGLKALWSAPILISGLIIQHNFIEQHMTTKGYPCERAGFNFDLGVNRWLDLIKISCN